ncbi:threonine aldolase family protein [Meridianimarinicoccus aquatilis]|uniref:L-threonine aldolase n=1 Tax=Meridianimarinicoccus aquatilis TaxID=2552766 RepID=A0A4R6AZT3_9RHOB|nr:low specificity L-threonine aldolase [Fluviibacterium aquatile]QIE41091.1 low specificity L-threonine aldolase [Rhodobacteraceae bacterium SC52]TDL89392.1 low specificity L-threonine aldolase [Fluviibacterium aquatile]
MHFASDNSGPVHPRVMAALTAANQGYAASYGADPIMDRVRDRIRETFEAPDAAVYLVATGTAANALILACLTQPWQTVFCARHAHIQEDECAAPEFYSNGAKLTLVDGGDGKMDPDSLRATITAEQSRGVHGVQRGPVSITQATEAGTVYSLDEIRALTSIAKDFGLPVHMDGARFSNALVRLGCSPADMTWRAGIDALSFGGTKNGLMGVEAVVLFDPEKAWEFELRRKRGAHLFSKHRYLSAQMDAYLEDGLWLDLASKANAAADRLSSMLKTLGVQPDHAVQANMVFARWPRATHQRLQDAGAKYYLWSGSLEGADPDEQLSARLVCDWSTQDSSISQFAELFRG